MCKTATTKILSTNGSLMKVESIAERHQEVKINDEMHIQQILIRVYIVNEAFYSFLASGTFVVCCLTLQNDLIQIWNDSTLVLIWIQIV